MHSAPVEASSIADDSGAYGRRRAELSRLDRAALEREVLRGDVDAFARAAFLGS